MSSDKLLKVRTAIKKRKPTFKRSQTNQFAKFKKDGWRKPKGMGNKLRRNRRGHSATPRAGYGSPKAVKGLNGKGFEEVVVRSVSDLDNVKEKSQVAVLARTLGARKRLEVLEAAKKKGVSVENFKSIDDAIKMYTKEKKVKKVAKKTETKVEEKKEEPKKEAKSETKKSEETKK